MSIGSGRSVSDGSAISSESLSPRSASPVATMDNFARLEANKKATLGVISSYVDSHKAAPDSEAVKATAVTIIETAETNLTRLVSAAQNYDGSVAIYAAAIEDLHQARDNLQGIAWHVGTPHPDGTKDLIRDARGLGPEEKDAPNPNSSVSFTMNYLNVSRAAELMLDDALARGADKTEIDGLRKQIRQRAIKLVASLKNGETIDKEAIVHLNHELVSDLKKIKIGDKEAFKDPKKTLNRTKNLTSLADEHRHITTLSTQKDAEGRSRLVAESEVMCLGTTLELAHQFESIARGETSSVKWYQGLPDDSKRILRKFAPQLAAGDKVISSQLGDYIPGFKNAYTKIVSIGDVDKQEHLVVTAEILHSGSVAYLGSEGADEATKDTIAQARSFTGPDDGREVEFALHTLNTGGPIKVGVEGEIIDRLEASAGAGVTVDVVPVNHFRRIASASHDFSDGSLREFATEFQSKSAKEGADAMQIKVIADFIAHGERRPWYNFTVKTDQDKALAAIKLLRTTHPDLARAAATAVRLRVSRDNFGDKNFRISTEAALVDHELNKMLGEKGRSRKRIFFCKSGKDRTGSVLFRATHLAVSDHLGLTAAAEDGDSVSKETMIGNLNRLANVGHTQIMAGRQGGVVGADGILSRVPGRVLDSSTIEVAGKLSHQTANYNKLKTAFKGWLGRKRAASSPIAAGVIDAAKPVAAFSYINPMTAASAVAAKASAVETVLNVPKKPVLLTSRKGPRR